MIPLRSTFAISLALASALAFAQQLGAAGDLQVIASNHNLSNGEPLIAEYFRDFTLARRPVVDFSADLIGNTGRAFGSAFASAGILKARGVGNSAYYDIPNQVPGLDSDIYGGGNVQATVSFADQITIVTTGFFQFSWIVTGGIVTTLGENNDTYPTFAEASGAMSAFRFSDHLSLGRVEFESGAFGRPEFVGGRKKFSAFLNAGDVIDVFGELKLEAQCLGGGTVFIDYGNSAYTVIERGEFGELGPGGFTSASGYGYGPAPVPEPSLLAALGLGAAAFGRRRMT